MVKNSATCYGTTSGKPLTEYDTFEDAEDGAEYSYERYGSDLVPYQCSTCDYWHLSPRDRHTATTSTTADVESYCGCVGSNGCTYQDAKHRAQILYQETGARLKVYRCPDDNNENQIWHLTHQTHAYSTFSSRKSTTCKGIRGQYLTEYGALDDAEKGAEYVLE